MDDRPQESRVRSLLDARNWEGLAPLLGEMGFADPARALAATRSLAEREALRSFLPQWLTLCADSADPDQALHGLIAKAALQPRQGSRARGSRAASTELGSRDRGQRDHLKCRPRFFPALELIVLLGSPPLGVVLGRGPRAVSAHG